MTKFWGFSLLETIVDELFLASDPENILSTIVSRRLNPQKLVTFLINMVMVYIVMADTVMACEICVASSRGSRDLNSYGISSGGLYIHGLYSYGLYSYGLYSYGLYSRRSLRCAACH